LTFQAYIAYFGCLEQDHESTIHGLDETDFFSHAVYFSDSAHKQGVVFDKEPDQGLDIYTHVGPWHEKWKNKKIKKITAGAPATD
jgi:hypothetical protein